MADPIEVNYTPDGDDWTVSVKGRGQTLTGRAPGLIAARDRADQLVEKIAPQAQGHPTVVHLLEGDALEFTTAYLTARMAKPDPAAEKQAAEEPAKDKKKETPAPRPAPPPRRETQPKPATSAN